MSPRSTMVWGTLLQKEGGHQIAQLPSLIVELLFNQMADSQGCW